MKRIIILISVLLIAIFAIAGLYFSRLNVEIRNNDKVLGYIPADASVVFEFRNDKSFYEIFSEFKLFEAILGEERIEEFKLLQNLIVKNSQPASAVDNQNTFLSLHHGKNSVEFLWLAAFNKQFSTNDLYSLLLNQKSNLDVKVSTIYDEPILEILVKPINKTFYLLVSNGSAVGSFSQELIKSSLNKDSPKVSPQFIKELTETSRKNANSPFNIVVNHQTFQGFLSKFLTGKSAETSLSNQLSGFSSLAMNYKSDALMFNGISTVDSSTNNFLNIFLNQKPVENSLLKNLPKSTANFITFGVSNHKIYRTDLHNLFKKRGELDKLNHQFQLLKATGNIDLDRDVRPFWGDEFGIFQLADRQKLAIVKLTNGSEMQSSLDQISTYYTENIRQFNNSNILYYYLGDPLKSFSRPYFAILDNFIILANAPSTVKQFLNDYNAGRLLNRENDFMEFNQFSADQSNVSLFIHNKNSKSIFRSGLRRPYFSSFNDGNFDLKNFYGLSYQWSADGDHFFTNLYINYPDTVVTSNTLD